MFQSYEYFYHQYNKATNQYRYEFKIIDTDFEEIVDIMKSPTIGLDAAIIDCYTRKGLSIASNFFRFMLLVQERSNMSLDQQIKWNRKYNPRWKEVEQDMQMYLMLS